MKEKENKDETDVPEEISEELDGKTKNEILENADVVKEITTELKKIFTFDILNYIRRPWKLLGLNFFMGLVRGIGFFLGMTIVGAIVFALFLKGMRAGIQANIPLISEWLARIAALVRENMRPVQ